MILFHIFKDIKDNYFEINEGNNINSFNKNKKNIDKNMADGIEIHNKKIGK